MKGFSLVELSIVLVILGLLTGGILAGQNLIRASELRSVSTQLESYTTAMYSFRDKYFALPGDMTNATAFWGKDNAACSTHAGTASATGTCNGDGDGVLEFAASNGATAETFQFWKQLALAGLIEGAYSGLSGASSNHHSVIDVNVPRAKISNAGISAIVYDPAFLGNSTFYNFNGDLVNHFAYGGVYSTYETIDPVFKPEELWNIDTKMDDGLPRTGKVFSAQWANCTTAANQNDATGEYNLLNQAVVCGIRAELSR